MKARFTRGRAGWGLLGALGALALSAVLLPGVPQAVAVQGQAIIAGFDNTSSSRTLLWRTDASGCLIGLDPALAVCGPTGLDANGDANGVRARGGVYGVEGISGTGSGVYGHNFSSTGIGVKGETGGVGSGVYGVATDTGVGVYGDTAKGTGVLARATGTGTALSVTGKAVFSRSGMVTIPAGATSRTVTLAGVTTASMVMALSQQNSTVFVRAATAAAGSFTIRLSAAAPAGGLKVAYFVLN
jgi:hypothetical protein